MQPDRDKLQFVTVDPNDKVVYEDEFDFSVSGPSGASYATSDHIYETTIPNPYLKKCMVRFKWCIVGEDYVSQDTIQEYSFAIDATAWGGPVLPADPGCKGAVSMYVDDNLIGFRINNGHHGTVTYTGTAMSPGPDSFTGIDHTYRVKFALYEVD